MKQEAIAEIRINADGRLCLVPLSASFPFVYRAGMEIQWDEAGKYLYHPALREWSYSQWFQRILAAVKSEYACALVITPDTHWLNVDAALKKTLVSAGGKANI